jgi:hypothetical protein
MAAIVAERRVYYTGNTADKSTTMGRSRTASSHSGTLRPQQATKSRLAATAGARTFGTPTHCSRSLSQVPPPTHKLQNYLQCARELSDTAEQLL